MIGNPFGNLVEQLKSHVELRDGQFIIIEQKGMDDLIGLINVGVWILGAEAPEQLKDRGLFRYGNRLLLLKTIDEEGADRLKSYLK